MTAGSVAQSAPGAPRAARSGARSASRLALVRRARRVHRTLGELHPDAHCELRHSSPLELLVATVLSAQCTDRVVNTVTPALFARYRTAADYAAADRAELEALVRPTGFRSKAAALQGIGAALVERYGGEVPDRLEDLVTLPGVGRKTASVVLGDAFGVPALPVDTHVGRLARRLELTRQEDPVAVERDLSVLLPAAEWSLLSHRLIFHGRRVCTARRPACGACGLARLCPSYGTGPTDPDVAARLLRPGAAGSGRPADGAHTGGPAAGPSAA